ncbi:hypothetical protein Desaci_4614 [Desulfosporosinus acidiphilus SJ4]|uniref:Uncharacterized protein n=1 Tax=Desulfosporosinus acidiphilus (strain DSM 22704 / JCM 16185 / SJ4) TaxID=646529 RepID=I4DCC5_DESAJ|nr:hypothetical protein [Desulfosporosinus acidiphilus]AFM43449.1 hypothetical protein Desaci_4614 [Desulfosporosinus acidiphilus SJ4]
MLGWGLIVIFIILLWSLYSHWEWRIPQKLEEFIRAEKNKLGANSMGILFDRRELKEDELEKDLACLQKRFPHLSKKNKVHFWIEVEVDRAIAQEPRKKYLTCLQRRFSDIEISVGQQRYSE